MFVSSFFQPPPPQPLSLSTFSVILVSPSSSSRNWPCLHSLIHFPQLLLPPLVQPPRPAFGPLEARWPLQSWRQSVRRAQSPACGMGPMMVIVKLAPLCQEGPKSSLWHGTDDGHCKAGTAVSGGPKVQLVAWDRWCHASLLDNMAASQKTLQNLKHYRPLQMAPFSHPDDEGKALNCSLLLPAYLSLLRCPHSEARRQGFSPGTPVSSPPSSV